MTATSPAGDDGRRDRRPSILIIEDEPGLAEVISLNLQASGFDTAIATDGLEALYALDREIPDLILLDLHLPKVSGFRLIHLLRSREATASVPVIVITAAFRTGRLAICRNRCHSILATFCARSGREPSCWPHRLAVVNGSLGRWWR